jgi:cell division initiation protein
MITPVEIRNHAFRKGFRGYDPEEVQAFLNTIAEVWEQQLARQQEQGARLREVESNYKNLKDIEHILHKTLLQAEQSSKNTMENARQKAELKVQEAEAKAREIVRKGIDERNRLEGEIAELRQRKEEILLQLNLFLKTQIDRLKSFERKELSTARIMPRQEPQLISPDNLFGIKDNPKEEETPPKPENPLSDDHFYDDLANEL